MLTIPDFNSLKKNLKKDIACTRTIKLAIVGDAATQFLVTAIKGWGLTRRVNFDIYEAPFNQIDLQVLNPGSELYEFAPQYVLIAESPKKLQKHFYHTPPGERELFATEHSQKLEQYYQIINQKTGAKLLYFNFPDLNDEVFGNFAGKYPRSFPFQLRQLNYLVNATASRLKNLFIIDLITLQARFGNRFLMEPKVYIQTDMALGTDILPYVAKAVTDQVLALEGVFNKCLILDLDNTLWGGVIGDDGLNNIQIGGLGIGKAYSEIQTWAKELKNRGIILCVASKNTEHIAMEPFEKHPEMVLRLDDISVFMANWDNKVKNIQRIQEILNIGFDSMVFVDDNPFERNMVRENLPDITVPELPEDPALYLEYLTSLNLFETASVSDNDEVRTQQYQQEAKRVAAQQYFEGEDDFLQSLNMESKVEPLNDFNLPRVAQLTQRSNQFNLRTMRYTEDELTRWNNEAGHVILNFHLADKFGDHGLIGIVMLEQKQDTLFIANWIMSCRVLKRGMENFTLNTLVEMAQQKGCTRLTGEYIPTPKNGIVKDHYADLGFSLAGNMWELSISDFEKRKTFITNHDHTRTTNH